MNFLIIEVFLKESFNGFHKKLIVMMFLNHFRKFKIILKTSILNFFKFMNVFDINHKVEKHFVIIKHIKNDKRIAYIAQKLVKQTKKLTSNYHFKDFLSISQN